MHMEELEKKAKAYDDVKEKIALRFGSNVVEEIFSEYEMNEDERIRKAIIDILNEIVVELNYKEFLNISYNIKDMVAWLKKQGEHKSAKNIVESWKDMRLEVYQQASGNRHEPNYSDDTTKMFSLNDIDEIIEKMSEQKSADKVEPKFHEGEWIIHQGTENIYQVVAIIDNQYQLKYGDNYTVQKCDDVDRCARLWDITKDAKDCDVLACGNKVNDCPFIFHNLTEALNPRSYGGINTLGNFQANDENGGHWCHSNIVRPATKEQRDFLFKKMKDAVWVFDFGKKKLKKIEQKSAWSEEDEVIYAELIKFFEAMLNCLATEERHNENRKWLNWLKSLKERIGWKPSEEQMEALTLAIHDVHEMWYKKHLLSLKQQLKQV